MKSNHNADSGLTFTGALTILFIGLKLTGIVTWSWWWVLSPIWTSAGVVVLLVILIVLYVQKKNRL